MNILDNIVESIIGSSLRLQPVTVTVKPLPVDKDDAIKLSCSCLQSCGSNFSRNGNCSCLQSCGSNYNKG